MEGKASILALSSTIAINLSKLIFYLIDQERLELTKVVIVS